MKKYVVIVKTENNRVTKYRDFDTSIECAAFIETHGGFSAETPDGHTDYWVVDATKKTVTFDKNASDAAGLAKQWASLREKRNRLLTQSDYLGLSDVTMPATWKTYRQALRDLPANTSHPSKVTWPSAP